MKMNRLTLPPKRRSLTSRRRGFTTPAVAIALVAAMCGLALVLDRLWLDAADLELTTAAEAAALAAAGELATDDLLKPDADPEVRFDLARTAAGWIASQNAVAGAPVVIDTTAQGDVRLGRLVLDDQAGKVRFEETTVHPTTAVVTAMRTRRSSNPVGLFVSGATGLPYGDVVTRVEASIDNRVCGVRPEEGTPVPAYPLAIWWRDPAGLRMDTWETQIEARKGADQFGYDPVENRVYSGADGIPEITLRSSAGSGEQQVNSNLVVVDLGTRLNDAELSRQFTSGWTVDDLNGIGGEVCLTTGGSLPLNASAELKHADREALDTKIGEPRICLLYSSTTPSSDGRTVLATCIRLVAIRVLAVRDQTDGSCEIIAQPCVVKTKTAILDISTPYSTDSVVAVSPYAGAAGSTSATTTTTNTTSTTSTTVVVPGNPYLYKLQLTH